MTAASKRIPLGTAGVRINLTATEYSAQGVPSVVPIQAGAAFQIFLEAPDGELLVRPGNLTGSGADGVFGYTLRAGDLTKPGKWRVQGNFELPAGTGPIPTSILDFEVYRNLYPLNVLSPGPAVLHLLAPPVAAVPYPVSVAAGSYWWAFGFDGVSAGDTRDSYPLTGHGPAGFVPVSPALVSSHMREYSLVRLEALVITAASNGGKLIMKRAADGVVIHEWPMPVPLDQPKEMRLGMPIEGAGGFTFASDQPTFVLSAEAYYTLITPTNP